MAFFLGRTPFHNIPQISCLDNLSGRAVSLVGIFGQGQDEGGSEATLGWNLVDQKRQWQQKGGAFFGIQPRITGGGQHCKHIAGKAGLPPAHCDAPRRTVLGVAGQGGAHGLQPLCPPTARWGPSTVGEEAGLVVLCRGDLPRQDSPSATSIQRLPPFASQTPLF